MWSAKTAAAFALLVGFTSARNYIENPTPSQMSKFNDVDCTSTSLSSDRQSCCDLRDHFLNYTAADGGGRRIWEDTTLAGENPGTFNVTAQCWYRSGYPWLRIQAPGTPDHPYASPSVKVEIQDYDYIIKMGGGASESDCSDEYCDACDWEQLGFGVVGLALNGVGLFSPLSIEVADPFYPPNDDEYSEESLDQCLGHPQAGMVYHYHNAPQCMNGYTGASGTNREYAVGNTACYDGACSSDYVDETYDGSGNYAGKSCGNNCVTPSGFAAGSASYPIGIALDGYVIYGPYNTSGEGITGLDNCNGKYVDGEYRYYATDTFPYMVGCFGPGRCDVSVNNLTCTANPPSSYCGQEPEPTSSPTVPPTECSAEYDRCGGGSSYTGPTTCCEDDNNCYWKTSSYAQCRRNCPNSDWLCYSGDDTTDSASVAIYSILSIVIVGLAALAARLYAQVSSLKAAHMKDHHHHHHHHKDATDAPVGNEPNELAVSSQIEMT